MKTIFKIGAILLTLLHLLKLFPFAIPAWIMAVAALVTMISGLFVMTGGFKKITFIFAILSVLVLIYFRQPIKVWISSINSMTNIVAILAAMQTVAIPFSMGRYNKSLRTWMEKAFRSERPLFSFSMLIAHILTIFLTMGAVPFSVAVLDDTVKAHATEPTRFLSSAISRGFILALLWAPSATNLILTVQATGVQWSKLLLPGIIMALLGFGLSYWVEILPGGILYKKVDFAISTNSVDGERGRSIFHVVFAVCAIIFLVLTLELLHVSTGYIRILIAGLVVSLIWSLIIYDKESFRSASKEYWNDGLLKVKDTGPFFVAIGFFAGALEASGLLNVVMPFVHAGVDWLGMGAVVVIPFVMILLAIIGLHPFITIVFFGKILSMASISIPPLTIALSLSMGGAISYMISPFAGIIMSISSYTNAKASDIALRWNWKFSVALFIAGAIFSMVWGLLYK